MNNFPENFIPSSDLESFHISYNAKILRREIYKFMISKEYKTNKSFIMEKEDIYPIESINIVVKELNELGWKTKLMRGNTVLYIYKSDENPFRYDIEEIDF